jgi:hypothetical protein
MAAMGIPFQKAASPRVRRAEPLFDALLDVLSEQRLIIIPHVR